MFRYGLPASPGFWYLNWAFWLHGILDLVIGTLIAVWPRIAMVTLGITDTPISYVWIYIAVGGLWIVGIESFYIGLDGDLKAAVLLLDGKIFWSGAVVIGHIVTIVSLGNVGQSLPAILWMTFGIFVVGFITWMTYRIGLWCCFMRRAVDTRKV